MPEPTYSTYFTVHNHREDCAAPLVGNPCDCPGPRQYVAVDAVKALLPKVYDGTHLADCPYIDVLSRIMALVDAR